MHATQLSFFFVHISDGENFLPKMAAGSIDDAQWGAAEQLIIHYREREYGARMMQELIQY